MSSNHFDPLVAGTPANVAPFNTALGQIDSKLSGLLAGNESFPQINLVTGNVLSVAGGAILITNSIHTVNTGAGAVTLNTITGYAPGDILILSISSDAARCVITTAGNINLRSGWQVELRNIREYMIFVYKDSKWNEIGSSPLEFWSVGGSSPYTPGGFYVSQKMLTNPTSRLPRLEAMPSFAARNWWALRASGATIEGIGISGLTSPGTLSEAANGNTTYTNFLTAASSGSNSGTRTTAFTYVHIGNSPELTCVLETGALADIANIRIWVGLTTAVPPNSDTFPVGQKFIGFRWSTVAADVTWQGLVADGVGQNTIGTGLAVANNTQYVLRFRVNSLLQIAYFTVNNGAEYLMDVSALAGTKFGFVLYFYTTNAVGKNLLLSRVYCEYN